MPPAQVTGLTWVESGYQTITVDFEQPHPGTGILLHYEYRVDSQPWGSTMSLDTRYVITGLMSGTEYDIRIRAVSNVGRGPASMPLMARTQPITAPQVPLRFRVETPGGGLVDQSWQVPVDDGGDPITHYEFQVTDPDGDRLPVDSTGTPSLRARTRGSCSLISGTDSTCEQSTALVLAHGRTYCMRCQSSGQSRMTYLVCASRYWTLTGNR